VFFQRPLPDFALTEMHYDGQPAAHPDSLLVYDIMARNLGVDWPPQPAVEHRDSVFVECRATFQRRVGIEWQDVYIQDLTPQLVTPMESHGDSLLHFEYLVPSEMVLQPFQPDRLEVRFSINGGNLPAAWRVWEPTFADNVCVHTLPVTDLPRRAWPSGVMYVSGQHIYPDYPDIVHHETCPQFVYLYLNDEALVPAVPAPDLLVEIGAGPRNTPPTEMDWEWVPAVDVGDMLDAHGRWYKIYEADLCVIAPQPGARSYCFRATFDWQDEDPHYLYIDREGTGPEDIDHKGYDPSLAGLLTDSDLSAVPAASGPDTPLSLRASPNPCNPATEIRYEVPRAGRVVVSIHDARGRRLLKRDLGSRAAGPHVFPWQGRDDRGRALATGVYFCRVEAAGVTEIVKVALIR
jgi:hypothetical protein